MSVSAEATRSHRRTVAVDPVLVLHQWSGRFVVYDAIQDLYVLPGPNTDAVAGIIDGNSLTIQAGGSHSGVLMVSGGVVRSRAVSGATWNRGDPVASDPNGKSRVAVPGDTIVGYFVEDNPVPVINNEKALVALELSRAVL